MKPSLKDRWMTARAFARNIGFGASAWRLRRAGRLPELGFDVPRDFFGICAASAADRNCDDYVVARLRELGVHCVRVDVMRERRNERFLQRLLDEGFKVCLHLVQSREEAKDSACPAVAALWRGFVADMLDRHGRRLDLVEIGSVCNRRKWSGYTLPGYLFSWRIAWEEAARRNLSLAGPNVTDFEPVYNVAILGEMKRMGMLPAVHTDNLFVERATEPEAFDHKILGRALAGLFRFDLGRKARLLRNISDWVRVASTVCSQVSWSLRRIARRHGEIEEKQADYLARYCCLAAASGALDRVYWGPMIGQREGLIDDGTAIFPEIPHVAFYGAVNGNVSGFRIRPAFLAFQTANRLIAGHRFKRKRRTGSGLEILEFENEKDLTHVVWTRDGRQAVAADCYEAGLLGSASALSRNGAQLEAVPAMFSESPVYLRWPVGTGAAPRETAAPIRGMRFAGAGHNSFAAINLPPWAGAAVTADGGSAVDAADLISLALDKVAAGLDAKQTAMLREGRNMVWRSRAPWNRDGLLVVKKFGRRSLARRILDAHKPNKAQRSWNASQELLRRGVPTPWPVAFFHKARRASDSECYFICREFENAASVRDVFTEAARTDSARCVSPAGAAGSGIEISAFYEALARFLVDVHDRGVFFRDLSAGNVLFRAAPSGGLDFALIDTARARFYPGKAGIGARLSDLIRVCHPLHWKGRNDFVGKYMALAGRRFQRWMKAPFVYYDLKHRIKNFFKPLRRR